jgi:dephospho-CoA kinase
MYVVFVCGGIGSGKSTVARRMQELGAGRLDLDAVSRDVLAPGSPLVARIADAFGAGVVDEETGVLDRQALARLVFASSEALEVLEALEHPAIRAELVRQMRELEASPDAPACCAVEVPLLDKAGSLLDLADEVMAVTCPIAIRRRRAMGRGMDADDFDRRLANQPTDAYVCERADVVIDNSDGQDALMRAVDEWFSDHERRGWEPSGGCR